MSGLIISPIIYMGDIGKVNTQLNKKFSWGDFRNFRGLGATGGREGLGYGIYFGVYQKCRDFEIPIPLAGGLAGVLNWGVTYPIDVIKNRQLYYQCTIREAYKQGKIYRGLQYCLLRAMIVNSSIFTVYEKLYKLF